MKKTKLVTSVVAVALGLTLVAPSALAASLTGNGTINYTEDTSVTKPVDPENPDEDIDEIDPGEGNTNTTPGSLTVDFVSHLKFGDNVVTTEEGKYYAAPTNIGTTDAPELRGNFVQITDKRAADKRGDGWKLTAELTEQFTAGALKLDGATLNYANAFVNTKDGNDLADVAAFTLAEGTAVDVLSADVTDAADKDKGWGTYTIEFGRPDTATMDKSVELTVPKTVQMAAETYTAEITWTIAEL